MAVNRIRNHLFAFFALIMVKFLRAPISVSTKRILAATGGSTHRFQRMIPGMSSPLLPRGENPPSTSIAPRCPGVTAKSSSQAER